MIARRPSRRRPPSSVRLSCLSLVIALVTPLWLATHAFAQSTEADVYVAQAVLEYSEGKYDEALANLRKALETEPDHVEALYLTGVVLMAKDQPAQATPFLEKARARSRTDPAIAFQLGLAYLCFSRGISGTPAIEASLLILIEPVLNPIWTFLAAGERMGPWAIAGGAVVLLATAWRTVAPVLTPRLE